MIGEAVPPKFTELHGHAIRGILEDSWRLAPLSIFDNRCQRATDKLNLHQLLKPTHDANVDDNLPNVR